MASETSQCFFLRDKVCCIWFYVFLIDVMRFFVYYRERLPLAFAMGDLAYSKDNHMPSYWDLWKGNCIYDFSLREKFVCFFICFHVMSLVYFSYRGSVFMGSEG